MPVRLFQPIAPAYMNRW